MTNKMSTGSYFFEDLLDLEGDVSRSKGRCEHDLEILDLEGDVSRSKGRCEHEYAYKSTCLLSVKVNVLYVHLS